MVAVHAPSAVVEHHPPEHIRPPRLGVGVGLVPIPRAAFGFAAGGEFVVHPLRNQRLVHRLRGPDPEHRVVDLSAPGPRGSLVEHLVAGVLGVGQDLVDAGLAPRAARPGLAGRLGRRVLHEVGVEALGDGVVAESFVVAPQRDLLAVAVDRDVADAAGLLEGLDALAEAATEVKVVGEVERETIVGGSAESTGEIAVSSPRLSVSRRRSVTAERVGSAERGGAPSCAVRSAHPCAAWYHPRTRRVAAVAARALEALRDDEAVDWEDDD